MLKMHLTTEQGVLVVKLYYKTSSYLEVKDWKEAFRSRFAVKDPPTSKTIWKNKKYERVGTSRNINTGRFGRRRIVRTEQTIEVVRLYVKNNAGNLSCRRNGVTGLKMVSLPNCYTSRRKVKIGVSCYFYSSPRGVFRTLPSI